MRGLVRGTLSEDRLDGIQSVMGTTLGGRSSILVSEMRIRSTYKLAFNRGLAGSKFVDLFYALGRLLCEFTGRECRLKHIRTDFKNLWLK